MNRIILAIIAGLLLPFTFAYLGGTAWLGAHIWWNIKVALIGAPIGVLVGLALYALAPRPLSNLIVFVILTVIGFGVASYGQMQFAASYGEDQFAATCWYFGWIGTMAAIAGAAFSWAR